MPKPTAVPTNIAPLLSVRNCWPCRGFLQVCVRGDRSFSYGGKRQRCRAPSLDGAEFWVGDESPEHSNFSPQSLDGSSVGIILTVADPDAVFGRAVKAGAAQVCPVGEADGWRIGRVVDPFGHHWEIGRPLA